MTHVNIKEMPLIATVMQFMVLEYNYQPSVMPGFSCSMSIELLFRMNK